MMKSVEHWACDPRGRGFPVRGACRTGVLAAAGLAASLAAAGPVSAQTLDHFHHLTVEDGLASNTVFSVYQDRRGYMWFGTAEGASLWDGYTFETRNRDLAGRQFLSFAEDSEGNLWGGTSNGLIRLWPPPPEGEDPESVVPIDTRWHDAEGRFYATQEPDGNRIGHVLEDPGTSGVYWMATLGDGLVRWNRSTGELTHFRSDSPDAGGPSDGYVVGVLADRKSRFWVASAGGLDRMDRGAGVFRNVLDVPLAGVPLEDPEEDGVLWLPERDALSRYDPDTGVRTVIVDYADAAALPDMGVGVSYWGGATSGAWDRAHPLVLWVAAGAHGIFRVGTRARDVEHYPVDAVSPTDGDLVGIPYSMAVDRSGVVWVGHYGRGVSRADPAAIRIANDPILGLDIGVTATIEDSKGRWWLGAYENNRFRGTLVMIDRETGERREWQGRRAPGSDELIPFQRIQALAEDRRGAIWIAEVVPSDWHFGGLYRLDPDLRAVEPFAPARGDAPVPDVGFVSLYGARDGMVWAGTYGEGILRIDPQTDAVTRFRHDPEDPSSLPNDWAYSWMEDARGQFWVGTWGGLCAFDGPSGTCRTYNVPLDSVEADRYVYSWSIGPMLRRTTEPDVLWITNPNSMFRFDVVTRTFTRPPYFGPLTSARPSIQVPASDMVLIGSEGDGLFRFDPDRRQIWKMPATADWFELDAGTVLSDGLAVLGTYNEGVVLVDTASIRGNTVPPEVRIARVEVDGTPRPLPPDGSPVRLRHDETILSIEYVGLHFSDPARNQYAYRLEGLNDAWQEVGTDRRATFGALAPADYAFRVRASNGDGTWSTGEARLAITVLPPWWRTGWAYVAYILLLLAAVLGTGRAQRRRIEIRERRQAAIRESQIRAEAAEDRARQAEELDEAKSRFFANVSHEFRTPLTLILGTTGDLQAGHMGALPDPVREAHDVIARNARDVDRLVRSLLDLSRLDSGRLTLATRPLDLAACIRSVVQTHTPLAERKRVTLRQRLPAAPMMVEADGEKLQTAVGNLIANAIKFTPSGGEVRVALVAGDESIDITVSDTGIGIAPEHQASVFDRFTQVDTSSTRTNEGIGIGLALARELVELHGGTIQLASEVGVGSTFTIRLPLWPVDGAPDGASQIDSTVVIPAMPSTDAAPEPPAAGDGASDGPAGRPSVLVVEDNADVRAFLRRHLSTDFQVEEAADGEEGLRKARSEAPDLVISDIMMPVMDGIELCRRLRADDTLRDLPIILLTARAAERDHLAGLDAGADEYVTKPFSVEVLRQSALHLVRTRKRLREDYARRVMVEPAHVEVTSDDASLLTHVIDVVNGHLDDAGFTIDTLADEVGLSRRQLQRRLSDICHESPSQLVRRMRLERARQLLEADVGTVSEIAYGTGYRSVSHFTAAFRQAYGVPPSVFRRQNGDA